LTTIKANAHAEKRLFISLLTRDISLADAFLDLLDNSINAALKASGLKDGDASDYIALLSKESKPRFKIDIAFDSKKVKISDNCGGISAQDASEKVFVFGATDDSHLDDRLSVYGIGLKRAMFKLGNQIDMVSRHPDGGFELNLTVSNWQAIKDVPWTFEIEPQSAVAPDKGSTQLEVTELHPNVQARLENPAFETELFTRISRAYSFFISRIVTIKLNGIVVEREEARISGNQATESFELDGVSVAISAGLGVMSKGGRYEAEFAGWNVYCNGRAVIFYDRSPLTGWGVDGYLPSFQPKHRPFVGIVFFTSDDPEKLPWTTTKLGVNPDNLVWQKAVHRMADVGRQITKFLDGRYGEDGTSITMSELADAIGDGATIRPALKVSPSSFSPPKKKSSPLTTVSYKVDKKVLQSVKDVIGKSSMSNSDAGIYTFEYFVGNEVD
jgi:hypothetical protein